MRKKTSNKKMQQRPGYALITGGAGFIGTNLAHRLLEGGNKVRIFDYLSRAGTDKNLDWLCKQHDPRILDIRIDYVRDDRAVGQALDRVDQVFHLAVQVAVTTSIGDPLEDFEINVRGTLNLLEALRRRPRPSGLIYTSTNKVYGNLLDLPLSRNGTRYEPAGGRQPWGILFQAEQYSGTTCRPLFAP
jgi:CDP-paratose 2-epimerase